LKDLQANGEANNPTSIAQPSHNIQSTDKRTYRIRLPPNAEPGSFVQASLPDGRQVTVQVPPQVKIGVQVCIDVVA